MRWIPEPSCSNRASDARPGPNLVQRSVGIEVTVLDCLADARLMKRHFPLTAFPHEEIGGGQLCFFDLFHAGDEGETSDDLCLDMTDFDRRRRFENGSPARQDARESMDRGPTRVDAYNRGGSGPQRFHPIVTTRLEGLIEPHIDLECPLNVVAVFHFVTSFCEFCPLSVWIPEDEARWVGALRALHATPAQTHFDHLGRLGTW